MRLHFQERPWDLYIVVAYALVISVVVLALDVGNLFAIVLVVFVPGYVLVATLFPRNQEIDWIERIALSLGLSVAIVPLFGLLLNFTPFGVRFGPSVATILAFTVSVGYAAYWRRMRQPTEDRLAGSISLGLQGWHEDGLLDKGLTIALAASMVLAGSTIAYVVLAPRPTEPFTEFYILGPNGSASGYPTRLNHSEEGKVILGIANHETETVNYRIRVDLVGVRIVYNATSGSNETVDLNRTTWSTFNVTLVEGQNWTQVYAFRIGYAGLWKVQFLLLRGVEFSVIHRELHLYIRVVQ